MLPQTNRIKKKKDFELIFKKGRSLKDGFLILKLMENNSDQSRFGFIVSQKVSKKATIRNKVKRRLRSAVEENLENIKKGFDAVLIVLSGLEKKEFSEIEESLKSLFIKAKIISEIKK